MMSTGHRFRISLCYLVKKRISNKLKLSMSASCFNWPLAFWKYKLLTSSHWKDPSLLSWLTETCMGYFHTLIKFSRLCLSICLLIIPEMFPLMGFNLFYDVMFWALSICCVINRVASGHSLISWSLLLIKPTHLDVHDFHTVWHNLHS